MSQILLLLRRVACSPGLGPFHTEPQPQADRSAPIRTATINITLHCPQLLEPKSSRTGIIWFYYSIGRTPQVFSELIDVGVLNCRAGPGARMRQRHSQPQQPADPQQARADQRQGPGYGIPGGCEMDRNAVTGTAQRQVVLVSIAIRSKGVKLPVRALEDKTAGGVVRARPVAGGARQRGQQEQVVNAGTIGDMDRAARHTGRRI